MTLGKSLTQITGFTSVTPENIEQIVQTAFSPTDDRSWLRKTVGSKGVAYNDAAYKLYVDGLIRTQ